jgi:outer membrane protein TolC
MKHTVIALLAGVCAVSLQAQNNIPDVLSAVEQNNTTLQALQKSVEARQLENRTDIYLPGPEVEFNYLWGSPTQQGDRKDFKLTQQFDYATLAGKKSGVANQQNALIDLQYKIERMSILTEARQLCIDIIYYNALLEELSVRSKYANTIAEAQKKRLDSGAGNQIEYNNVVMSLANIQGEVTRVSAERKAVESSLALLNGGQAITLTQTAFDPIALPANFDEWYAGAEQKSPTLAYVRQEVELSKRQLSLNKSLGVPSLTVGYMSENTLEQKFRGVTVGLSIPLWSNRNKVRQAKTAVQASELNVEDAKLQFYTRLNAQYDKTLELSKVKDTYRTALSQTNNSSLLMKAYDEGQITVLDYLLQMGFYYDAVNQALTAERDFQKSYNDLISVEL